jgi:monoamine oxidase
MAQPIADKLFFAGEATSPDAFCTVHGAYLSGQRALQEIDALTHR